MINVVFNIINIVLTSDLIINLVIMDKVSYIPQLQLANLTGMLEKGKVFIIYGPRRVGKTTLLEHFVEQVEGSVLSVSGEDITVRQYLESQSIEKLSALVGNHDYLVIDEAQHLKQIGLNLKLIVDHIPDITVIATGSSSIHLAGDTGAPLAGRQYSLRVFPLAQTELGKFQAPHETDGNLEMRLIYGSYPEVVLNSDNEKRRIYLRELVSAYLFRDILELEGIRNSDKLLHLLQLLAFQIGNEVSVTKLGSQLGMSKNTASRYLDLLEKAFIVYRRRGFSRNLRKEIAKSNRWYFVDNGIRNSIINNFNPLNIRDDAGALWENYIVTERLKRQEYYRCDTDFYFWRTYDQKEIDLIEERQGRLFGYEIKWAPKRVKKPHLWLDTYSNAQFEVIDRENYLDFIT